MCSPFEAGASELSSSPCRLAPSIAARLASSKSESSLSAGAAVEPGACRADVSSAAVPAAPGPEAPRRETLAPPVAAFLLLVGVSLLPLAAPRAEDAVVDVADDAGAFPALWPAPSTPRTDWPADPCGAVAAFAAARLDLISSLGPSSSSSPLLLQSVLPEADSLTLPLLRPLPLLMPAPAPLAAASKKPLC